VQIAETFKLIREILT